MYNEDAYNATQYDITIYAKALTESLTPSDSTVTFAVGITLTDSQATADAISDGVNMAAFLETVNILQRARTPFMYNGGCYNWYMYNARLDDDEILLLAIKVFADALTLSDTLAPYSMIKVLLETLTPSDTLANAFTMAVLMDFLFFFDAIRVEISNKALNDTILLNDWLGITYKPHLEYWGN